jgi:hypothetical protein
VTFDALYVFVVLSLERGPILHANVVPSRASGSPTSGISFGAFANMRADLHQRNEVHAAMSRTTGERARSISCHCRRSARMSFCAPE